MKRLVYTSLVLALMAGCSSGPTLQELKDEAMITGDWTLVEKREKAIERRRNRSSCSGSCKTLKCGPGQVMRSRSFGGSIEFYCD